MGAAALPLPAPSVGSRVNARAQACTAPRHRRARGLALRRVRRGANPRRAAGTYLAAAARRARGTLRPRRKQKEERAGRGGGRAPCDSPALPSAPPRTVARSAPTRPEGRQRCRQQKRQSLPARGSCGDLGSVFASHQVRLHDLRRDCNAAPQRGHRPLSVPHPNLTRSFARRRHKRSEAGKGGVREVPAQPMSVQRDVGGGT